MKKVESYKSNLVHFLKKTTDNNALTGAIPSDIGLLTRLKYLTFSDNLMSGEVPSELGNLIRLENLDISKCINDICVFVDQEA